MTIDPPTQTLAQLGAATPHAVAQKFAEVRARFDADVAAQSTDHATLLAQWTGRKSGALTQIGDNWLKPAPKELKPIVGQEFQKLKSHVEATLEAKRKEMESAADDAAAA